jgi:2-polyprenyl-3-methyl-5-hydroxy-6-metoxy-1,4-benzoquinol methylase
MDYNKETFETWNKIASLYEQKFMHLELYNQTYDFICESISTKNAKILELGCGPGNITKYILSKRPDFKIYGTDIAPNMIELARKNNPTANFRVMDCREINEITDSFDGIVCGFIVPYLSPLQAKKLVVDVNQLLGNNGLFYLSFVEGAAQKSGFKTASTGDRSYFFYHQLDEILKYLLQSSFEILKVFNEDYKISENEFETHTIIVSWKKSVSKKQF